MVIEVRIEIVLPYFPLALVHIRTVVISLPEPHCDDITCLVDRLTTTERRPGSKKKPDSSTLKIASGRASRSLYLERTPCSVSNQRSKINTGK